MTNDADHPADQLTLPAVNLAEVPAACLQEAQRRRQIVEHVEARLASLRGQRRKELTALAHEAGIVSSTLYTWMRTFRDRGFAGLIPAWGKTKGRFTALSPALQDAVKGWYLDPRRPSPTTVARRAIALAAHLHEPAPSHVTVIRYLRTLPAPAVVLAREGPQAWRAQAMPKCERNLNACAPNDWWVSDHREFDLFVRVSDDPGAPILRPWLTAWLDLGTRTCVGWHVSTGPDSQTIALALRAGILRYGVPRHLYRDNGKDYTCHYWGRKLRQAKAARLSDDACAILQRGVVAPLGVAVHEATPYTPWAKPIEPWFSHTFPEWERTLPGWCGADNKQRPEKLAAEIREGRLLTLADFTDRVAERLDQYHATEHRVLGCAPRDKWSGVTIERPAPRALDLLLMRHKPVTVTHQGIKLFGRRYWADELTLNIRHVVDVRYDPADLGRLIVLAEGRFLCEATNQEALRMGLDQPALKAHLARQREAKRRAHAYLQDRQALMDPDRALAALAAQRRAGTRTGRSP